MRKFKSHHFYNKNTKLAVGWKLNFVFYITYATNKTLILDKVWYSKISRTYQRHCLKFLFNKACKYGDSTKISGCSRTDVESFCVKLRKFVECHTLIY
jgi:hypothetical protein